MGESRLRALETELRELRAELARVGADLVRAEASLEEEHAKYRELFALGREGFVVTDPFGSIREANRSAAALLNIPADYLHGKPLAAFVHPDDRRAFRIRVNGARDQAAEQSWLTRLTPRESSPMTVACSVSPTTGLLGEIVGLRWFLRDVSRRDAEAVAEREPGMIIRVALDALAAHVAVLDGNGLIITTNRAWREAPEPAGLFAPTAGDGSSYFDLCLRAAADGRDAALIARDAVERVLGGAACVEATYSSPGVTGAGDAAHTWFAMRVSRCDGPDPLRAVVVHDDVTAERRALERERELLGERAARMAAEESNRVKSEFLATLSHELRTPLNAIGGYAQLLEMGVRGPVTVQQADDLRRIRRSEEHLLSLINELLNYARLERGDVRYTIEPMPVLPTVEAVLELVRPQAEAAGLGVALECRDGAPHALADRDKLAQIVLNLLSNAMKYTAPGGTIRLVCESDADRVHVSVVDSGPGIPEAKLEAIFDPFVQLDRGAGRTIEGVGLGLAISRGLAQAMSGTLTVESELGRGSTFRVSLPRVPVPAELS